MKVYEVLLMRFRHEIDVLYFIGSASETMQMKDSFRNKGA